MRKVKRAQQAARRGVDDTSDIEPEGDEDSSMIVGSTTNVKKEKDQSHRRIEDIDED